MDNIDKQDFEYIIGSILNSGKKERKEIYLNLKENQTIKEAIELINKKDVDGFYYKILYPFNKFTSGLIESEISAKKEVIFLLKNSEFIENHFSRLFEQIEGVACSADKARTIQSALLNFYLTGNEIKFNYNQEYTFHLPKRIFTNHKSIIDFFESLELLFIGYFDNYINELKKIL
jgi:hypothetical protein